MLLGLDFDNTLICYDELFHSVALEKGLIPKNFPAKKNTIRNYLIDKNQEEEWTHMQGEVYGARMKEAVPFKGMFEVLKKLKAEDNKMCIVSHKTRTPYKGPSYDLHKAAQDWLERNDFFVPKGLSWNEDQVFFEVTKFDKVKRIISLGCTHYVDDLPEILSMLPKQITKIHFSPDSISKAKQEWLIMNEWSELPQLLQ